MVVDIVVTGGLGAGLSMSAGMPNLAPMWSSAVATRNGWGKPSRHCARAAAKPMPSHDVREPEQVAEASQENRGALRKDRRSYQQRRRQFLVCRRRELSVGGLMPW